MDAGAGGAMGVGSGAGASQNAGAARYPAMQSRTTMTVPDANPIACHMRRDRPVVLPWCRTKSQKATQKRGTRMARPVKTAMNESPNHRPIATEARMVRIREAVMIRRMRTSLLLRGGSVTRRLSFSPLMDEPDRHRPTTDWVYLQITPITQITPIFGGCRC